jgi:hypothetical protein
MAAWLNLAAFWLLVAGLLILIFIADSLAAAWVLFCFAVILFALGCWAGEEHDEVPEVELGRFKLIGRDDPSSVTLLVSDRL